MDMGVKIAWVECQITIDRSGENTMGKGFDILTVAKSKYHEYGFDIPWIGGSKFHG
jgi:hypothetical protein